MEKYRIQSQSFSISISDNIPTYMYVYDYYRVSEALI